MIATATTNYTVITSLIPASPTHGPAGAGYIKFLNSYAAVFVVILGVIGNSLSITVLLAVKSLRTTSTGTLLTILAFADTGALLIGLLPVWIKAVFTVSLYEDSVVVCKFRNVFMYFSLQYSSSILVLIAIERFVSVYNPARAKGCFTLRRTGIIVASLGIFLFLLNSHAFVTAEIVPINDQPWCYTRVRFQHFLNKIWVWIDFLIYSLIPWVVLSACNVAIVVRVRQINRRVTSNNIHSESSASRRSKLTSMTVMLLVVNTSFLITTMPFAIYLLCNVEHLSRIRQELIYESLYLLSYMNNAINFLLYVISGAKFRSAILELFRISFSNFVSNPQSTATGNTGITLTRVNSRMTAM